MAVCSLLTGLIKTASSVIVSTTDFRVTFDSKTSPAHSRSFPAACALDFGIPPVDRGCSEDGRVDRSSRDDDVCTPFERLEVRFDPHGCDQGIGPFDGLTVESRTIADSVHRLTCVDAIE